MQVREALRAGDWESASQGYLGQVRILWSEGRDYRRVQREAFRCRLMSIRSANINRVEVMTAADERVCAGCQSLDGKTFTVALALERGLLPGCAQGHSEPCRCVYTARV